MSIRRTLASITPEDLSGGGRPCLYAYGRRWIERLAGRSSRTLKAAISSGDVDPANPVSVVAWCARARGRKDLSVSLLKLFGLGDGPERIRLWHKDARPCNLVCRRGDGRVRLGGSETAMSIVRSETGWAIVHDDAGAIADGLASKKAAVQSVRGLLSWAALEMVGDRP